MTDSRHVTVGDLVEIFDDRVVQPSMLSRMKETYGLGVVVRVYESFFFNTSDRNPESIEYGVVYFFSNRKKITLSLKNIRRAYQ